MRYPTISVERVERLVPQLVQGHKADVENATQWHGAGPELDLHAIETHSARLRTLWDRVSGDSSDAAKDAFEGEASGPVHECLSGLPLQVLDDPGFWRFLCVGPFWWLVHWRERRVLEDGDWTRVRVYVDGLRPAENVLLRMFIRGQIALNDGTYDLAGAVPKATDLWKSHIVRVRTSYTPAIARALVREQKRKRMNPDELRSLAKRLNRASSNFILYTYDDDEADEFIRKLRGDVS